jgi:ketosteroid isomerase-like protein
MSIDPVALVRRYHAALEAFDAAVVGPMFSDIAVYVSPGVGGRIGGRDAIMAAFAAYFAEHPEQRADDEEITQTGPREARALWRLRATPRAGGRPIDRRGIETVSFDAAGLILRVEVEDR